MKLEITVRTEGEFCYGGARIEVDDPMCFAFEPLRTTDDPIMAIATGDTRSGSYKMEKKLKIRKDAAEYLSKVIADHLLSEMSKGDTFNGYKTK